MTTLLGLRDVPWQSLEHAYGPASDTPDWLEALASGTPPARKKALGRLRETIHHQTETYDASAATVPFLVVIACDRDHPDRVAVLELIADLAIGHPDPVIGFDIRFENHRLRLEARDGGIVTYEAVRSALPRLAALVMDADPSVRTAIPYVLALFADKAAETLPLVRKALDVEDTVLGRTSLLLAMRLLARYAGSREDVAALEERVRSGNGSDPVAVAAAIARLDIGGSEPISRALLESARPMKKAPGFFWGDLLAIARWVVDGLELDAPFDDLVSEVENPATANSRCWKIASHLLPRFARDHSGSMLRVEDISPDARRLLVACARRNLLNASSLSALIYDCGFPGGHDQPYWLGLEAPRPLEEISSANGRHWPVWKWLQAAQFREEPVERAVAAVVDALSVERRVELVYPSKDATWGYATSYRLYASVDGSDHFHELDAANRLDDLMARILQTCGLERLNALTPVVLAEKMRSRPLVIAIGNIVASRKEAFPSPSMGLWQTNVDLCSQIRPAFASLSLKHRDEYLREWGMRRLERHSSRTPNGVVSRTAFLGAWEVADLCPTPSWAEVVARELCEEELGRSGEVEFVLAIAKELGSVMVPPLQRALSDGKSVNTRREKLVRQLIATLQPS